MGAKFAEHTLHLAKHRWDKWQVLAASPGLAQFAAAAAAAFIVVHCLTCGSAEEEETVHSIVLLPPLHLTVKWSALKSKETKKESWNSGASRKKVSAWLPSFDTFPSFKSAWLTICLTVCVFSAEKFNCSGKEETFQSSQICIENKEGKKWKQQQCLLGPPHLSPKKIAENKRQFWRKESIHNCSNSNAAAKGKTPFQLFEYSKLVLWRWWWWSGGSDIEIGQAVNMSLCVCMS